MKPKKILIILLLFILLIILSLIVVNYFNKESNVINEEGFDQSIFYLGKWNGKYLIKDDKEVINFIAVTSIEQANYLKDHEEYLHVDTGDFFTSEITVHLGDDIHYSDRKFKLINLETKFNKDDLLALKQLNEIVLRENNQVLARKNIGQISFVSNDIGEEDYPFDFEGFNVTYSGIDKVKVEFINATNKVMRIKGITLENPDLNYTVEKDFPAEVRPNEKVEQYIFLQPTDESKYDFWIITPKVLFEDGTVAYLPSSSHNNYGVNEQTIKKIIDRD